ncbi:hypothetical protein MF672_037115 [Actinomadura sp. ATCC 31491]|uniref:Septum formation-related domain-containing protein n=1 Tax=Actinomadura luzonensis TaxID=2805427 RepID=A0ABT0G4Q8_9ACTN|nr:hypothetical protein [Actinomadura luzonensis]MCK2219378.1 hypothetical protein [Actinomadura luzonensis]
MTRHLTAAAVLAGVLVSVLAGALAGCAAAAPAPPEPGAAPAPGPAATAAARPGAQQYHASELRPGDCIAPLPVDFAVTVVSCSVPHAAEYATSYVVPEQPWPGEETVSLLAREGCAPLMRYVPSRRPGLDVVAIIPAQGDWPRYRTAYCLAVAADGGDLVGRVIL